MSGAIHSFDVVCAGALVIIMFFKKLTNKCNEKLGSSSSIRDQK